MKWVVLLLIAAFVVLIPASAEVTTNVRVPIDDVTHASCALGGSGEDVHISGTMHILISVTFDERGGTHLKAIRQMQVSGVGLTSGDKYVGTTADQTTVNFVGEPPANYTREYSVHLIGQGPGNNLLLRFVGHITINANGEVTALFDKPILECR